MNDTFGRSVTDEAQATPVRAEVDVVELTPRYPTVSVCMITYNQDKYVETAIRGVLEQRAEFEIELLIADDQSTDGTATICRRLADEYPRTIRFWRNPVNLGMRRNFEAVLRSCRGKYVAFCEGDDFWIDTAKLEKQVGVLESDKEIGLVHTAHLLVDTSDRVVGRKRARPMPRGDAFRQLLAGNSISTLTVLARRDLIFEALATVTLPDVICDYPLWLHVARSSEIVFMPDVTAAYRVLDESASHSRDCEKAIRFCTAGRDVARRAISADDAVLSRAIDEAYFRRLVLALLVANQSRRHLCTVVGEMWRGNVRPPLILAMASMACCLGPKFVGGVLLLARKALQAWCQLRARLNQTGAQVIGQRGLGKCQDR